MLRELRAGVLALVLATAARAAVPGGYVEERLPNGLLVSILADPSHPVVATQLWIHAGSAQEDEDSRGLAHLFEHLMFDGSQNVAAGEYRTMIQGMGGVMSITGERDDLPGGGPQKVGVAIADLMTGMYSTVGILGVLRGKKIL